MSIDYTSRDFASLKQDLTDKLAVLTPELTNKNESEFAIVMIDLFAYVGDLLSYSLDRYANESFLQTAIQRDSVVKLCNLIGYQLRKPKAAYVLLKFTIPQVLTKDVIIPANTICYTSGNEITYFETLEIATISVGQTYVEVLAKHGETKNEIIGYSDFSDNQSFSLSYTPLLDEISVLVNSDEWSEVTSFFNSNSADKHYSIKDENPVLVEFSNGVNGMIPALDAVIFASYRVGGGTIGNVGSGTIVNIKDQIFDTDNNIVEITVNNESNAYGGAEQETIEEAKINAPKTFASNRAVTVSDYNNLVSLFSDDLYGSTIKAISERDAVIITQVNIFTWSKDDDDLLIEPSTELKNSLKTYLDELSMIGINNVISNGLINEIDIEGDVFISTNQNVSIIQTNVEKALKELFNHKNIEPGDIIAKSKIYKAINSVPGVSYCDLTTPSVNIQLAYNEMAKLGNISINYQYE
jgi:hypothetical protein